MLREGRVLTGEVLREGKGERRREAKGRGGGGEHKRACRGSIEWRRRWREGEVCQGGQVRDGCEGRDGYDEKQTNEEKKRSSEKDRMRREEEK